MKITTKTGDDGFTSLFGGERVSKASPFIEAVGQLDELNSFLGWVAAITETDTELIKLVKKIQDDLYRMMAVIGAGLKCPKNIRIIGETDVKFLEKEILKRQKSVEKLRGFVAPGGGELNSRLHIARSVCRRAERSVVRMRDGVSIEEGQKYELNGGVTEILKYLNRLSDLLFILAF
jgi:cob(I)alamin adenosyltransferase